MATIRIPTPLRRHTNGERLVSVSATTLRGAIAELEQRFPGVGERLVDANGQLHRFVSVFVGEEDVRLLQGLETPLAESSEVSIIPAMAGG
ncbi:MAG: MoaD/ThiS family protein [Armatimonadota bacterium]|nr:MoaD/ThiS family protein [Armatimonadota bacterium]